MLRQTSVSILLAGALVACGGGSKTKTQSTTPTASTTVPSEDQTGTATKPSAETPYEGDRQNVSGTEATTPSPGATIPDMSAKPGEAGTTTGTPGMPNTPGTDLDKTGATGTETDKSGMGTAGTTGTGTTGTSTTGTGTTGTSKPGTAGTTGTGTQTEQPSTTPGGTADTQKTAFTEGAVLAALQAANEHEIAVASLATKSKNRQVRSFAAMMIKDHTAMKNNVAKLAKKIHVTPEPNGKVDSLKSDSMATVERLRNLSGADLDRAFAEQMVDDHQKVLSMIDEDIKPAVLNSELSSAIEKDRPRIEHHLSEAKALRDKLTGGSATTAPGSGM